MITLNDKLKYLDSVIKFDGTYIESIDQNDKEIRKQLILGGVTAVLNTFYGFTTDHYSVTHSWIKQKRKSK